MARTQVKLRVDTSALESLDLSGVQDYLAAKAEEAFRERVGKVVVDHAKSKAPVSKRAPSKNPRKKSFQPVRLIARVPAGRGVGDKIKRLKQLRENEVEVNPDTDVEFFVGVGANEGKTPDKLSFRKGAVVGAFQHKPGTLRDSIHVRGVRREGSSVIMDVVASAPYAYYVHEGFMNRGKTRMAPRKFFKPALSAVRAMLKSPSTYNG